MKTKCFIAAFILVVASFANAATNDPAAALQQGLFEEEANHNLDAAIQNYQSVVNQLDKDRKLAATAVFRLAECYRKQGKTNEAAGQYERILRDFSDQPTLTTMSRQNLTALGRNVDQERNQANTSEHQAAISLVEATILSEAQDEVRSLDSQIKRLKAMSDSDRRVFVQQYYPNPVLISLMQRLAELDQKLASLQEQYGPNHSAVVEAKASMALVRDQINDQVNGVIKGLEGKRDDALEKVDRIRKHFDELRAAQAAPSPAAASSESAAPTDEEQQEIRRIQNMIRNSPDLINVSGTNGSPLYAAASKGQLTVATFLLDHGANINYALNYDTPLIIAAKHGHKSMVELLLSRGADIRAKDRSGKMAFHIAVMNGFQAVAEVLLAIKAEVNTRDNDGNTPLVNAVSGGNTNLIEILISHGADVNARNQLGETPLMAIGWMQSLLTTKALLAAGADPNLVSNEGRSALSFAAGHKFDDVVEELLAVKADPNRGSLDRPLFEAIHSGDTNVIQMLLQAGAGPSQTGAVNWAINIEGSLYSQGRNCSPLELSVAEGRPEIVKLLLRSKADPNGRSFFGTPLIIDTLSNTNMLQSFLDAGADPKQRNKKGWTTLMIAVAGCDLPTVELLLAHGADPNAPLEKVDDVQVDVQVGPSSGRQRRIPSRRAGQQPVLAMPLHIAVVRCDTEMVQLLLAHGANPNSLNANEETPLDIAKNFDEPERSEMEALLRQHGALDDVPRLDRIEVRRPSANYSDVVFKRGTNEWNRFSLLELIASQYGLISTDPKAVRSITHRSNSFFSVLETFWEGFRLSFPDLKNVLIRRITPDGKNRTEIKVDVENILKGGDCAKDVWLQWGDVVEVPEADHPVSAKWDGLDSEMTNGLTRCVGRRLNIVIKGETTTITLAPLIEFGRQGPDSHSHLIPFTPPPGVPKEWNMLGQRTTVNFMVLPALDETKLLRASSDLARVKITRRDPATGKTRDWVLDCSNPEWPPDFWVRDGDVIEVPEKP